MERERRTVKKMPDRQTLEEFVNGMSGPTKVVFNIEKGIFEWVVPRPQAEPKLGEAKTELGRRWKNL